MDNNIWFRFIEKEFAKKKTPDPFLFPIKKLKPINKDEKMCMMKTC